MRSHLLTGNECLHGLVNATTQDFWRWGFSDLLFNDVRGVFGEWLVACILGLEQKPRESWAAFDLITPSGVRIEVKTAAFLQAWAPDRITENPVFSGLKGQIWALETGYSGQATYNADLYVFCLQIEKEICNWDAFDLAQWRFFLLTQEQLFERGTQSITLSALRSCTPELTAEEFHAKCLVAASQTKSVNVS